MDLKIIDRKSVFLNTFENIFKLILSEKNSIENKVAKK